MYITSDPLSRTVIDYDFTFANSAVLPITLDPKYGDSIEFGDKTVRIDLKAKPSLTDPTQSLPAEEVIFYLQHLVVIQKRERVIQALNPEQQYEYKQALAALGIPSSRVL